MAAPLPVPPRWPQLLMHAVLPDDPMRDAIVGDLHEEFVHDATALGTPAARVRYCRRATGIALHAAVDALRWRGWASASPPVEVPAAAAAPAVARRAAGGRGLHVGLVAAALGVLSVGIVVNTMLFASVRHGPHAAAPAHSAVGSAVGVGAVALTLVCAGVAAVVLCAGPRWLRQRRLHRQRAAR